MVKSNRVRWVGHAEIAPLILNLGIRRKSAVSFMPPPIYLRGKLILITSEYKFAGPRTFVTALEKKNVLPLPGVELRPTYYSVRSPVAIQTMESCLISVQRTQIE